MSIQRRWLFGLAVVAALIVGAPVASWAQSEPDETPTGQAAGAEADDDQDTPDAGPKATPEPPAMDKPAHDPPAGTPPADALLVLTGEQASPAKQLKITITKITGLLVQVRLSPDEPWHKAKAAMPLTTGAEIRTGPRSIVQFTIEPGHTITLDRLGVTSVLQAIEHNGQIKTEVGMKYGRVKYEVHAGGVEHESVVSSPSATLAVRGSRVILQDHPPFTPLALIIESELSWFTNMAGQTVPVVQGQISGEFGSAAETEFEQTVVDPTTMGRAVDESDLEVLGKFGGVGRVADPDAQDPRLTDSADTRELMDLEFETDVPLQYNVAETFSSTPN
ncbi:MAG: FecR domain-containing protein [Phycisphaeraceae bacterium]|nr:FecR domain-containing protein [Phycisphaeraceae bacterium]